MAATFTALGALLAVVVVTGVVLGPGRTGGGLRPLSDVAAVAGPVPIAATVAATLADDGTGRPTVPATVEDDDADLLDEGRTTDGWSIINTEGDVDADTRAAYLAAALAHRDDPFAEPMVVRWAAEAAGEPAVDVEEVAQAAEAAYADPRGWSLGGLVRFERVRNTDEADFVLVVAEAAVIPSYSEECVSWLTGVPDASCAVGDLVIINDARWLEGALGDPIPLSVFRIHEINHETGHWLGQGHFSCLGGVAAVNQQQFRSLDGCRPSAWPQPWEKAMVAERFGLWTDVTWPSTVSYDEWTEDQAVGTTGEPTDESTDGTGTAPTGAATEVTVALDAPTDPSGDA